MTTADDAQASDADVRDCRPSDPATQESTALPLSPRAPSGKSRSGSSRRTAASSGRPTPTGEPSASASTRNPKRALPVRWIGTATSPADALRAAHAIAELISGLPQTPLPGDRPTIPAPFVDSRSRVGGLSQVAQPIGSTDAAPATTKAFLSELHGDATALINPDRGEAKNRRADSPPVTLAGMEEQLRKGRKPATIHVRPGIGGRQPNLNGEAAEAIKGLEEYGEITWHRVGNRADLGIMLMDPEGTGILMHRLSGRDIREGETFRNQLQPNLALVEHYPEIKPRLAVFALHMSGTRDVRQDRLVPPPDTGRGGEREDINVVLDAIAAGWLVDVVFRGADRVARDVLPAEMIIAHLKHGKVNLWLSEKFGKVDYRKDRLALRAGNMLSAEEKDSVVERLFRGLLNSGPLAGNGWTSSKRLGFYREGKKNLLRQDPVQFAYIRKAFELAATGHYLRDEGLSIRQLEEALTAEGFPIDHDRLRVILRDPIYVTGEHTCNVKGQEIQQKPIELVDPVPLATFQKVQILLDLRRGGSKRTPIGEYLLNYVETQHELCGDATDNQGRKPSIKGYVLNRQKEGDPTRTYRHNYHTPEQCRGHTWDRAEIEHPIVAMIRELVTDPLLLERFASIDGHSPTTGGDRLTEPQRLEINRELEQLEVKIQAITDDFATKVSGCATPVETFQRLIEATQRRRDHLERRLKADDEIRERERADSTESSVHADRVQAFLDLMTPDPPDDPYRKALRARLFQCCVSKVVLRHDKKSKDVLEVYGPLVPGSAGSNRAVDPIASCRGLLDQHLGGAGAGKSGSVAGIRTGGAGSGGASAVLTTETDANGDENAAAQTDLPPNGNKSVCARGSAGVDRPSRVTPIPITPVSPVPEPVSWSDASPDDFFSGLGYRARRREANAQILSVNWHKRLVGRGAGGEPAWSVVLRLKRVRGARVKSVGRSGARSSGAGAAKTPSAMGSSK